MKTYKRTKIKFFSDSFTHFKPFDEVDANTIVSIYDRVYDYITSLPPDSNREFIKSKRELNRDIEWQNSGSYFNYYHLDYVSNDEINNPTINPIYYNGEDEQKYSLYKKDSFRRKPRLSCGLLADARHEKIYDAKKYIYLEFPKDIIMNYMTNLSCWDIESLDNGSLPVWDEYQFEKIKKYVSEVESSGGWTNKNWVTKLQEYDTRYPNKTKYKSFEVGCGKPPYLYQWRIGFYPEWYISVKDMGIIYPKLVKSVDKFFSDGIHRLVNSSLAGQDMPYFLKLQEQHIGKDIIDVQTPEYFNKERLYMKVDLKNKVIDYYIGKKHIGNSK